MASPFPGHTPLLLSVVFGFAPLSPSERGWASFGVFRRGCFSVAQRGIAGAGLRQFLTWEGRDWNDGLGWVATVGCVKGAWRWIVGDRLIRSGRRYRMTKARVGRFSGALRGWEGESVDGFGLHPPLFKAKRGGVRISLPTLRESCGAGGFGFGEVVLWRRLVGC